MSRLSDLTGQRFGRLTVLIRSENDKYGRAMWVCRCDCGEESIVQSGNLKSGHTKSCGCFEAESRITTSREANTKHGMTKTRLFSIWQSMLERCHANGNGLKNYGLRGITVCDDWKEFEPFAKWAIEHGFVENAKRGDCTLDRIDVNGNYCPENCRWVTNKVQQNNRRNNVMLTYDGKTQSMKMWSEDYNIPYGTFRERIRHLGWGVEEALLTPIGGNRGCYT